MDLSMQRSMPSSNMSVFGTVAGRMQPNFSTNGEKRILVHNSRFDRFHNDPNNFGKSYGFGGDLDGTKSPSTR